MKDIETKNKFIELRAKGLSYAKIARRLHVSKQTLINWDVALRREIANLRVIELDALQERYRMTAQKRLELFGRKLKAISDELDKRNLSNVPTEKLVTMFVKLDAALGKEKSRVFFTKP